MELYTLFQRCLDAPYIHVENSGDYAIEREGNHLFLFFEKSSNIEDWFSNLDFPMKAYRGDLFAHRGFLTVWESVLPYVTPAIEDPTVDAVTIVGYSHGGALAVLSHGYVWEMRPDLRDKIWGYGFGAPRVIWGMPPGDKRRPWQNFTVVRNLDDLVTHLPPRLLGYTHVGRVLEVGEKGKYSGIDAHRPENYKEQLWKQKLT